MTDKNTRTLLAEYLAKALTTTCRRDIDIAISDFEDAQGYPLECEGAGEELENCREELDSLQARETANSDCLVAIESRLFPMCIPAREISTDDLAYICEQFEKLEF